MERGREKGLRETEMRETKGTDREGEMGINREKFDPSATEILNIIIPDNQL